MQKIGIVLGFLMWGLAGMAQSNYWIFFTDKGELEHRSPSLSPQALSNRTLRKIPLDERDFSVFPSYLETLHQADIQTRVHSRWLNAVSASLTEIESEWVMNLPFVKGIRPVAKGQRIAQIEEDCPNQAQVGTHWRQLNMIGLDVLHRNGWTGRDIRVAVFDNGFDAVDTLEGFEHLFEEKRVLATRDYIEGDETVYHPCVHCRHGTFVLSIMAAKMPGKLLGSAPDASYMLLKTENDSSETHQEEDNWVAAAEYADSLGAEVFNTSLGYRIFDQGEGNYDYPDLDGETAIITIAADIAASKGILVINSAGNSAASGVNAPADGKEVLSIGAVDECEEYARFSSRGPTVDGRIKPDLSAMGEQTFILNPNGEVRRGNGTSFSAPLIAGLGACLWEAFSMATREDIAEAMRLSASQVDDPDNRLGYGIPNGPKAYNWLAEQFPQANAPELQELTYESPFQSSDLLVFPNPNSGSFRLAYPGEDRSFNTTIQVIDLLGRRVAWVEHDVRPQETQIQLSPEVVPGMYVVQVVDRDRGQLLFSQKVLVRE